MRDDCAHNVDHARTVPQPAVAAGRPRAAPPITGVCARIPFKVRAPAYGKDLPWMVPDLMVTAPALWAPRENLKSRSRRAPARRRWRRSSVDPGPRSPGCSGNVRAVGFTPWAPGPCDRRLLVGPQGGRLAIAPQLLAAARLAIVGSRIRSRPARPVTKPVKDSLPRARGVDARGGDEQHGRLRGDSAG